MRPLQITINGETYPCSLTMGAMIRFREVTGHEVSQSDGSIRDTCAFIWACVTSCARREKRSFNMDFMDFCDMVDTEEIERLWDNLQKDYAPAPEGETEEEKKR